MIKTIEGPFAVHGNDLATGERGGASKVLDDYYRCPENFSDFVTSSRDSAQAGYFRLGRDTVCYGRLANGGAATSSEGDLPDTLNRLSFEAGRINLPFDAAEVVENLRRERYAARFRQNGRDFWERAYYLVRPLLGVSTRRHLQRARLLRAWEDVAFPHWPVDTTVERIHKKLLALVMRARGLKRIPFIWFWPEGYSSCAIITHDVEGRRGRDFCSQLMDLDESFGFRSAFQIVPEGRYAVTESFLQSIAKRGFEVNVHDLRHDGLLYTDPAEFLRRAARINHYARIYGAQGFRSGILYRNADWYDAFDFSYDMSIPNVAHLDPQRGGCCTVMPFFIGKIVELPLTTTQDYTLFHILDDYSLRLWQEQIGLVRANHGLVNLLIHPDYVVESRAQCAYKELLEYVSQLRACGNLWMPLPREVTDWWRQRSQMKLAFENGDWQVRGPGKERARIAYAELVGDEIVYSLAGPSDANLAEGNQGKKVGSRPKQRQERHACISP